MTTPKSAEALAGLPEYLKQLLNDAIRSPWNRDPRVREHIANLERWLSALASREKAEAGGA